MLCESSAWRSLQKKTAILNPAIAKWYVATLIQGVRMGSGGFRCMLELFGRWLFFLKNPGRIFWTYGCSPVNSGQMCRCHVVLLTTFCMQMWPHHKRRPQRIGYLPVNSGKCNVVLPEILPASFCMQMWPHRKLLPAAQHAALQHTATLC